DRKDDSAGEGQGNEHVSIPDEVRVEETQDQQGCHPTHVGTPGRQGQITTPPRLHDDADPEQHGEDRDELPVRELGRGEPYPPVQTREVTVRRRVPAGQTGECEELDVDGKHPEHANCPEHVERPDPRRGTRGKRRFVHASAHSFGTPSSLSKEATRWSQSGMSIAAERWFAASK